TECWEIIAQSLAKESTQHFYSGAFGEKWKVYTQKLVKNVSMCQFGINEKLPVDQLDNSAEIICVTHNETSNGTCVNDKIMRKLAKARSGGQLLAYDATSSMAGVHLPWEHGDIWYASVQKCFGLPAGLALLVLSPAAVARAQEVGENHHYNSLLRILENAGKEQTHHTPNVLNIYLLKRTQELSQGIEHTEEKVMKRSRFWSEFVTDLKQFELLSADEDIRSHTVLAVRTAKPEKVRNMAAAAGFALGSGYGEWKPDSFRIANFPAIKRREIEALANFFRKNFG
ncbi:MAG: aminotransferase class V-fold PLP-dependent enzyme, partial [Bacteroidota bacterium]